MTTLSIKDVPDQWAQTLRERAARNHRSLQGELMAIIEAAVQAGGPTANSEARGSGVLTASQSRIVGYDRFGGAIRRQGWKTVEQVAAELNAKYPEPILGQALGVDIIRADRDSR